MTNPQPGTQENGRTARICIVDDNQMAREVIADQLSLEPYHLVMAQCGIELLDKFEALDPDVILMDVMMPQMNGYDVCRKIKQKPAWQHIPIILVTALNSREDMLRGLDSGADEFLPKPVNGAELRARVRTMLRIKNQYDSMQNLMKMREDLAHMLIHDMRNPLAVATLYNDFLLRRDHLTGRDKEYALVVHNSLRGLAGFLDEILTVAKMEEGMLKLACSPTNLNDLIVETAENHHEMAQVHGFRLKLELPDQQPTVTLDAALFKRVLDNLLSNAFKFAPEQSEVTVRLRYQLPETAVAAQPAICLQIIDEGPGISPENKKRIFNKYEVVKMKQSGKEQLGLGLAFCKLVIEAHNGRIYVTDNQPKGAIFNIEM